MNLIELERWERSKNDPRKLEYVGQPTAEEVFHELKHRLESTGYLPDEYFLMDSQWEDGREIPKDADIFCTTDYGGSEGIYLDVYLKWYDKEQKKSITQSFITGKTLGEDGSDLDRMFLISSAITKAFHGYNEHHTRLKNVNGQVDDGGSVFHLSVAEQQTIINALTEQREHQEIAMAQIEQVLRRMTGSITAYMDTVGQRPLHMSDYDKAVLAIRDGELSTFKELLPKVNEQTDDLFLEVAGRPGEVGRKMTLLVLANQSAFSLDIYTAACQRTIEIADSRKLDFLLEQAPTYVKDLPQTFYGELADAAYWEHGSMALQIIGHCTQEQLAAFPSRLLKNAVMRHDVMIPLLLAESGINGDPCFADLAQFCAQGNRETILRNLMNDGMKVSNENYAALLACIQYQFAETGKLLLDKGMDFEGFQSWAQKNDANLADSKTFAELQSYWNEIHEHEQTGGMDMA